MHLEGKIQKWPQCPGGEGKNSSPWLNPTASYGMAVPCRQPSVPLDLKGPLLLHWPGRQLGTWSPYKKPIWPRWHRPQRRENAHRAWPQGVFFRWKNRWLCWILTASKIGIGKPHSADHIFDGWTLVLKLRLGYIRKKLWKKHYQVRL